MPNPSLTRRINALPNTLSRLMSGPAVSESLARADESKRRLACLLPLDGVEQSAIDEYHRDWLARYVYNSNANEPIAIKHDAGRTYAGQLEQWQAYGDPAPLACMVAGYVVREQGRIGEIVSDIRHGHGTTSAPDPYTPLPMPDPAVRTTEPTTPEQGLGML